MVEEMAIANDPAAFHALLDEYGPDADAAKREQIEADIWQRFGVREAVFVLDMSGFSSLTARYGAVHYLSMVRRMHLALGEIVQSNDGNVVKFEADNCFGRFPSVAAAVRCAVEANERFAKMNVDTEDSYDIRVCVGIAFGDFLLVGGHDLFGDPVNRASRLGEDIAEPGEILVDLHNQAEIEDLPWERIERETGKGLIEAARMIR